MDWYEDVLSFHQKFGVLVASCPSIPDQATKGLRVTLIKEEVGELLEALENDSLVGISDGAVDCINVET